MEVLEAIKTRRSIRHYKPDPIEDKLLQAVLDAARWAPSWANTQCCRFVVVRDSNVKTRLAGVLRENNPATRAITNAPIVIVACAELLCSGYHSGIASTDKGDWYMYDVGIAMQNLALAAHSLGLGTVHVGAFDAQKAAEILGVPAGFCVVAMTPLGFPEREGRVTPRKELPEIVFQDKYPH
jgi:nitroreductase